jgi:hypothetical protein
MTGEKRLAKGSPTLAKPRKDGPPKGVSELRRSHPPLLCYDRVIGVYLFVCTGVYMEEIKEAVRWNIKVSKETDLTLRTYLGARGMKKGDLSKFIEEAVRWRIFNRAVQEIKARNAGADPGELQAIVDAARREVRTQRRAKRKG